ncbi:ParA family protein [Enterococcus faecium]|nr:ParA family protein [Enterococcus faecium]
MNVFEKYNLTKNVRKITVGNEKGGVGKTSIIRLIPFILSEMGFKCLIIDKDTQSNTTKSLYVTRSLYHEEEVTIFNKTLMRGIADGDLTDLIINVKENLDFIPSSLDFASFPTFLSKKFGLVDKTDKDYIPVTKAKYNYFKSLVDNVAKDYDFVFFDTPPTMSDYTQAAAFASDYILIAFQTQSDSLDGAKSYVQNTLKPLVEDLEAEIEVMGILPNQVTKNGSIDNKVIDDAKELFGEENIFENIIPYSKAIQNIPRNGITREGYWNEKMFTNVFEPITDEFLRRISALEEI